MKTKQQLLVCVAKFTCLFAVVLAGLIQSASAQLTIQIVNDSGLADSNIYVMVPGTINQIANTNPPITPTNLFVGKNVGTNVAVALSTLAMNGSQPTSSIVSAISGKTDTVYSIQADNIASGGIYFIYNQAFGFTNGVTPSPAAGSPFSPYRFDYAELSFDDSPAVVNDIDLTYVDKFGIPMQLEWFHGTNTSATNLIAGSYVYASTKTLAGIFSGSGFSNAVYSLNSTNIVPGWTYAGTNSYADFARILAPQKITADFPYPGIANYLNYLTTNPFVLNGYSVQGTNYYLGYQVSTTRTNDPLTGITEWLFTLAYNSSSVPAQYSLPDIGATNIQQQYTNTITFLVPNVTVTTNYVIVTNTIPNTTNIFFITNNTDVNAYVYGSPVGPGIYSVNGSPVTNTNSGSYSVESWMIGDVFSAINFGFAGGIYGTNSDQWFSPNVAWPDPYGWAQPASTSQVTNAYYNAYAALMYYNADAYSYAFSERITPGVGLPVADNDIVRITILPDDRLDSPIVSVPANTITATNLTLNWAPVPDATGYRVNLLRPTGTLGFAPTNLPANATSYTFNGLMAGAPYVMSVQAMGTNNGNPVITPARPVSATTSGVYTTINGNSSYQMAASFSVPDTFYQLGKVYINGIELLRTNPVVTNTDWLLPNGQDANWTASPGTNQVPVTVYDNNGNLIFNDWLTFTMLTNSVTGGVITTNAFFFGQIIGGGPVAASPGAETVTAPNYQTVIGLSYKPAPMLQYAPQPAASPLPSSVTITGVISLPGGGIQFNFNVPAGTNYVVESTTNLLSGTWQTNFNGMSQSGSESYTNTAGTNAAQFYRIKM